MKLHRCCCVFLTIWASMTQISVVQSQTTREALPAPGSAPSKIAVVNGLRPFENRASRKVATNSQRPVLLPTQMLAIDIEPSGGILQPNNPIQKDNLLTIDLLGATLAPGPGNKLELKMPYPGIQSISLIKVGNQKLRLEILGDKTLPTLAWNASDPNAAVLTITPCPNGFIPVTPASTHGEGSARLMYDLDAQGCPFNIRVDQSDGNPAFDRWALQSLQQRQYRFNGTLKDARLRLTYEVEGSTFQQTQQKRRLNPSAKQESESDRSQ
jgi:hypothetical protein